MCGGFSPLAVIVAVFVLFSLGIGAYIIKRNPPATLDPIVSISPTPVLTSAPTPTSIAMSCVTGGCSGELCFSEKQGAIASICIYKPEFACYKKARCEVKQSGVCGWTQTSELVACIKSAKITPAPTPSSAPCNSPIDCPAPPIGCNYKGSSMCSCGRLVCPTPFPTSVIITPISSPLPTSTPSPTAPSVVEMRIEADDLGFYPGGAISFPSGTRVKLTFAVRTSNVYYGGLDFRSSKFSTTQALPGQTATVEFIANSSFIITSYWPSSGVYKASLSVNVQ